MWRLSKIGAKRHQDSVQIRSPLEKPGGIATIVPEAEFSKSKNSRQGPL